MKLPKHNRLLVKIITSDILFLLIKDIIEIGNYYYLVEEFYEKNLNIVLIGYDCHNLSCL